VLRSTQIYPPTKDTMGLSSHPVLIVLAISVTASLLAEFRSRVRVPAVVWQMVLGILVGPYVLDLVRPDVLLDWLGRVGLLALFFMAGMELDLPKIKGRPLTLGLWSWLLSLVLAFLSAGILHLLFHVRDPIMLALALATTAMGTFLPMLRDEGRLTSSFGSFVVAAGVVGEFGPVIAVSLILTRMFGTWEELALMFGFVVLALLAALIALGLRPPKMLALLKRGMHSSTQLPVGISLLLLAAFDVLSTTIGLESILGAFTAGMVVGLASRDEGSKIFRGKIEAVCFGFVIPFFFVVSGLKLDLHSLVHNPRTMLLVPGFLALLLIVRGAPVFLYRNVLANGERWPFALYSATALPMIVVITSIGVRTGTMRTGTAAALIGAGLLSVLIFPSLASTLLGKPDGAVASL
jgi:Kef-type K+ transport system membrane component KefB